MIGTDILHYRILEKLGEGGMGVVYLAEDSRLSRRVAIKFLPEQVSADPESRRRFLVEARAAAALNHPNIATIYAIEESSAGNFIAMEYLEGRELKDILLEKSGGRLAPATAVDIARQIAEGLQAAHARGIVHRDIKSANIMISPNGQVRILDFGLAKIADGAFQTRQGATLGTYAYMSPEQTQSLPVDARSDIWSLGVVLYEMLTGKLPFGGSFEQELFYAILNEEPPEAAEVVPDLPAGLSEILKGCLAKDPDQRFADGGEVAEKLAKILRAMDAPEGIHLSVEDPSGTRIGPYQIREILGEGGMGEVYLAEQQEPVRRQVALKIIKLGMDSKQIVARFEAERQALAVMDHPNIARVFAAGTTDKGRPFFAMEYVPGMPLNDYCDTHRLSTSERLDLFVRICSAVQHAHQKGVIHRDLKPSNILVTELDGQAVPKIIDFGIAKAIHTPLTAQSLITAVGEVVGTPAYMSPEQLKAGELDIDTRSDIYSLGVILYELLSGNLPFEAEDYRQPSGALQKILLENDPPTPSRRMSTAGDKARRVAENRRTDAIALRKKLQGDLDWITIKAMEKERTRRYETANGLAVDLKRYLNNEPVSARPPSNAYRLGKFVQRNKLAVGAGAIALAGLLIGLTAAVVGFVRATEAERQALLEAETARRVSDFMVETFRNADPTHTLGDTILASSLIEESVQRISRDLRDQPRIQSRLMQTMGRAYLNLGLYEKGIALLDSTLAKQRRFLGEDDPEFANTLAPLGKAYHELGENEKALSSLQAALGIYRRHNSDFKVIGVLNDLMEYWDKVGDYDSSLAYARKAVDLAEKYPDSPEETVAKAFARMGMALNHTGEYGEAIKWMRRGLDQVTRFHPETNPTVQVILNDLAICLESAGQNEEASRHLHKVVELSEKLWGVDHWQTAISYDNLGNQLSRQGKFDEAITYFRKAGENFRKYYGEDHIDTGINYNNQGFANFQRGDYEEADRLFRASNRILRKVLGDDHPYVGVSCYHLANVQMARKNWSEARRFNDIAIELIRAGMGEKHPRLGIAFRQRGSLNLQTGRYAEAQPALEQAIRIFSEAQPPDSSSLGIAYGDYAEVMRKTGHTRAADSLAALAKTFGGE